MEPILLRTPLLIVDVFYRYCCCSLLFDHFIQLLILLTIPFIHCLFRLLLFLFGVLMTLFSIHCWPSLLFCSVFVVGNSVCCYHSDIHSQHPTLLHRSLPFPHLYTAATLHTAYVHMPIYAPPPLVSSHLPKPPLPGFFSSHVCHVRCVEPTTSLAILYRRASPPHLLMMVLPIHYRLRSLGGVVIPLFNCSFLQFEQFGILIFIDIRNFPEPDYPPVGIHGTWFTTRWFGFLPCHVGWFGRLLVGVHFYHCWCCDVHSRTIVRCCLIPNLLEPIPFGDSIVTLWMDNLWANTRFWC